MAPLASDQIGYVRQRGCFVDEIAVSAAKLE